MTIEESKERQQRLEEILEALSKQLFTKLELCDIARSMNSEIYAGGFRHFYSGFYPVLMRVFKESAENADYLTSNLDELRSIVEEDSMLLDEEQQFVNLYFCLPKLVDHINLEIARHNTIIETERKYQSLETNNKTLKGQIAEYKEELAKLHAETKKANADAAAAKPMIESVGTTVSDVLSKVEGVEKKTQSTEQNIVETRRKLEAVQSEYITILGIFAAVVWHGRKFCVSDIRQSQEWRCGNRAKIGLNPLLTITPEARSGMRASA